MRQTVKEILDSVGATRKPTEKLAILEQVKDRNDLKLAVQYALDPFTQFFMRQVPEYTEPVPGPASVPLEKMIFMMVDVLAGRLKTGGAAKEWMSKHLELMDPDDAHVIKLILQKDLRCGMGASTANKVWPELIDIYDVLLCESYETKYSPLENGSAYAIVQTKMDGLRANLVFDDDGKTEFKARSGKTITDLGAITGPASGKFKGVILDGEILFTVKGSNGVMRRAASNGLGNKAIRGTISEEEASRMVFVCWDITPYRKSSTLGYEKRFEAAGKVISELNLSSVDIVSSQTVRTEEEIMSIYANIISKAGEGIVVKDPEGMWVPARTYAALKMKEENEIEMRVKEVSRGTGKFSNTLGSLYCELDDRTISVNVSGFTDAQRHEIWKNREEVIDKVITVRYNVVTKNSAGELSLDFPRIVTFREDKNETTEFREVGGTKGIK